MLLLALSLGVASPAAAQGGRKPRPKVRAGTGARDAAGAGKGDFFRIRTPKINYVRPDTTTVIETEELPDDDSDAAKSIFFSPVKPLSIVSEDTSSVNAGGVGIYLMLNQVVRMLWAF